MNVRYRPFFFVFTLIAAATLTSGAAAELPDVTDPVVAAETWLRLKGDTSGKVTYEWVRGTATGISGDALATALFQIESVTIRQARALPDDGWEERTYACRLYRDAQNGKWTDRFVNPYTGETIELTAQCGTGPVVHYVDGVASLPDFDHLESTAIGTPMKLSMQRAGENVVIRREARSRFAFGEPPTYRFETSADTFVARAADVADEGQTSISSAYNWTSVTQWMRTLGMGDRPGHMLWNVNGFKYDDAAELPADFRRALEDAMPGALDYAFD